jgi:hypothetical protein
MQVGFPEGDHAADRGGSSTTIEPGSREKRTERPKGAQIAPIADTMCDKTTYHFVRGSSTWLGRTVPHG